ncbi:MAG TPA: hypothetical protein VFR67_08260 [Pilimelia sp.]|nr:hypothetical protein [Pilimelia sp.]
MAEVAPYHAPPPGEWRSLPPVQRQVGEHPLVNPPARFAATLTSWQAPSFLAPLGHAVGGGEPAGIIDGLATTGTPRSAPDADTPMPVVARQAGGGVRAAVSRSLQRIRAAQGSPHPATEAATAATAVDRPTVDAPPVEPTSEADPPAPPPLVAPLLPAQRTTEYVSATTVRPPVRQVPVAGADVRPPAAVADTPTDSTPETGGVWAGLVPPPVVPTVARATEQTPPPRPVPPLTIPRRLGLGAPIVSDPPAPRVPPDPPRISRATDVDGGPTAVGPVRSGGVAPSPDDREPPAAASTTAASTAAASAAAASTVIEPAEPAATPGEPESGLDVAPIIGESSIGVPPAPTVSVARIIAEPSGSGTRATSDLQPPGAPSPAETGAVPTLLRKPSVQRSPAAMNPPATDPPAREPPPAPTVPLPDGAWTAVEPVAGGSEPVAGGSEPSAGGSETTEARPTLGVTEVPILGEPPGGRAAETTPDPWRRTTVSETPIAAQRLATVPSLPPDGPRPYAAGGGIPATAPAPLGAARAFGGAMGATALPAPAQRQMSGAAPSIPDLVPLVGAREPLPVQAAATGDVPGRHAGNLPLPAAPLVVAVPGPGAPPAGTNAAITATVVAQRAPEAGELAGPVTPEPEPLAAVETAAVPPPISSAPGEGPPATPGGPSPVAGAAAGEPEELLTKIFDPLLRRLKAELRVDRDRRGLVTDTRH